MENKPWPYWLKGALIFGCIFLPAFWINENNQGLYIPLGLLWWILGYYYIIDPIDFLTVHLIGWAPGDFLDASGRLTAMCLTVLFYMLLGGSGGWLYGKIKTRYRGGYGNVAR